MNKSYFHRVHDVIPTRFWINNLTLEQAKLAIEAGAIGCTTNPEFRQQTPGRSKEKEVVRRTVDLFLS